MIGAFMQNGAPAKAVGTLALWQMNNQGIDTSLRVGLPIVAFLTYKSHKTIAVGSIAVSTLLWVNRLTGLNL